MKKTIDLPFLMIPTNFVAWEQSAGKGHNHCAILLAQLRAMRDHASQLNIFIDDEGYMYTTTSQIMECMYYIMPVRTIKSTLKTLEADGLIRRTTRQGSESQRIYIDETAIEEKTANIVTNNRRKFFAVYYVTIAHSMVEHNCTQDAYLISAIMQLLQASRMPTLMADGYVDSLLANVFSASQRKTMMQHLQNDGIIDVIVKHRRVGEAFVTERRVIADARVLQEMIRKHHRDNVFVSETQYADFNSVLSRSTSDSVKSNSYSQKDIDEMQRYIAELEADGEQVYF